MLLNINEVLLNMLFLFVVKLGYDKGTIREKKMVLNLCEIFFILDLTLKWNLVAIFTKLSRVDW